MLFDSTSWRTFVSKKAYWAPDGKGNDWIGRMTARNEVTESMEINDTAEWMELRTAFPKLS